MSFDQIVCRTVGGSVCVGEDYLASSRAFVRLLTTQAKAGRPCDIPSLSSTHSNTAESGDEITIVAEAVSCQGTANILDNILYESLDFVAKLS